MRGSGAVLGGGKAGGGAYFSGGSASCWPGPLAPLEEACIEPCRHRSFALSQTLLCSLAKMHEMDETSSWANSSPCFE